MDLQRGAREVLQVHGHLIEGDWHGNQHEESTDEGGLHAAKK